jgi:hypothetical protein
MNASWTVLAVVGLGALALLAGCTANKPFRTSFTPCDPGQSPDCKNAVIEATPDYKLGFVEFDDQGWFWDTNQLKAVEDMIQTEGGVGQSNNSSGIVIMVFVHGWKNNAAVDNANVVMFRQTLAQLAAAEKNSGHTPRKIVGVYGGWRGLSAQVEPFKELSFWERKNTAHKVGGYGALTELLVDLENLQDKSNASLTTNAPRTELIIVGHSFGGAAVFSALGQIVTERFAETVKHGKVLKPLGDQVILLNPAFEALRYYDLNQMTRSITLYPASQRPVLSIFTSKGDWATHYFFPMGRFFSTVFQKNSSQLQRAASLDAVGWFQPFVTHDLCYNTNAAALATNAPASNETAAASELRKAKQWRGFLQNIHEQRKKWHPNNTEAQTYYFVKSETILRPRDGHYRPGDPFLVVSVDKKIMKDHDDITNPRLISFLGEYILFCQNDSVGASP